MNKEYTITKEQILQLADPDFHADRLIKKWFPEAFEVKLEVGKWYKSEDEYASKMIVFAEAIKGKETIKGYGFGVSGNWLVSMFGSLKWRLATYQEVEAALIAEAKKRGFKEGVYYRYKDKPLCEAKGYLVLQSEYKLAFSGSGWIIFQNGVWGEIIPTMTKQEAEAKLNCKII